MSKADGKVVIRTDLDNSSLPKGVKGIKAALSGVKDVVKSLGSTIAAAFSVAAIVKFSKEATSAATAQTEAEKKLETIMRRRMNATDESIQSVKDYASALQQIGVIGDEVQLSGLQELATYVDNPDSLKKMNMAMNDMLAQQYGLNATAENAVSIATMLGKVLDGQTSALSRYGYSFTDAQERLLKYGTEEQRVATLAEVIGESVGGMNAALAQTPDGKMKQLKNAFGDVMETAGIALKNFLVPVIDVLNILVQKLAVAANAFKAFSELITGKKTDSAAAAYTGTAEAIEGVTEATEDAEKAQKRYTAGFDEIQKIGDTDSGSGADSTTPGIGALQTAADSVDYGNLAEGENIFERINAQIKKVIEQFKKLAGLFKQGFFEGFGDSATAFADLKEDLESIWNSVGGIFTDSSVQGAATGFAESWSRSAGQVTGAVSRIRLTIVENLVGGIESYLSENSGKIREWLIHVFDIGGELGELFGQFSVDLADVFSVFGSDTAQEITGDVIGIFSDILMGATTFVGEIGLSIIDDIVQAFSDNKERLSEALSGALEGIESVVGGIQDTVSLVTDTILPDLVDGFNGLMDILSPLGDFLIDVFFDAWENYLNPAIQWFGDVLSDTKDILEQFWNDVCVPFGSFLGSVLAPVVEALSWGFENLWKYVISPLADFIGTVFSKAWEAISAFAQNILIPVLSKVISVLQFLWNNVLSPVVNFLVSTFKPAFEFVLGAIKGFIDTLKNVLSGVFDFITGIFSGDWGKAWEGLKSVFTSLLNGLIKGVNSIISVPFKGINWVLEKIKGIDILGLKPFNWVGTINTPQIPLLAQGAVLPPNKPFLAMVGDQKNGTNVEAPLATIQEAVAAVTGEQTQAILAGFETSIGVQREILEAVLGIHIGDDVIGSAVARYQRKMAVVRGGAL